MGVDTHTTRPAGAVANASKAPKGEGFRGEPLRVCGHACRPAHFENCPVCFGYGVHREPTTVGLGPLCEGRNVHLAIAPQDVADPPPWMPCPNCGGSPLGLPQ